MIDRLALVDLGRALERIEPDGLQDGELRAVGALVDVLDEVMHGQRVELELLGDLLGQCLPFSGGGIARVEELDLCPKCIEVDGLRPAGGINRLLANGGTLIEARGDQARLVTADVPRPIGEGLRGIERVRTCELARNAAPPPVEPVGCRRALALAPSRHVVLDAIRRHHRTVRIGAQLIGERGGVAGLTHHERGHADHTVEVGEGLGEGSAHATLLKHHPEAVVLGLILCGTRNGRNVAATDVIEVVRLGIWEVRVRVGKLVLLLPAALPDFEGLAGRTVGGLHLLNRAVELGIVVKTHVAVPAVARITTVIPDVGVRVQATILSFVVSGGELGERVIRQPGQLRIGDLVFEDQAHALDRQRVEQVLLKAIALIGAECLDGVVAHERIGYKPRIARPQARTTRDIEGCRNHHAQVHIRIGTRCRKVGGVRLAQAHEDAERLDVVGVGRYVVLGIGPHLAARDVIAQRREVTHEPIEKLACIG